MIQAEKWDRRFLELAKHVSTWSKDPSTKVGAVIVNPLKVVVGMGYNGFPRGVNDNHERYDDRETKYKLVVHAEENAILSAGNAARGSTIYVYPAFGCPPLCSTCAKSVIQAGIVRTVGYHPNIDEERAKRWATELEAANLMCSEAGIQMDMLVDNSSESADEALRDIVRAWSVGNADKMNADILKAFVREYGKPPAG